MKNKFYCPNFTDKRLEYAVLYLEKFGYQAVNNIVNADFVLLGVNPDKSLLNYNVPIFAGNIDGDNIIDYTKDEEFALYNAFLTSEGAITLANSLSDKSMINSDVLIIGYGRIGKSLEHFLSIYTSKITVCARNKNDRCISSLLGSKSIPFEDLKAKSNYDFIFNTVPHMVLNREELGAIDESTMIIDLASFPGGVDKHYAKVNKNNLVIARGLPAKYSSDDAGYIVAKTINKMIEEGAI